MSFRPVLPALALLTLVATPATARDTIPKVTARPVGFDVDETPDVRVRPPAMPSPVGQRSADEARALGARWLASMQRPDGGWGAGTWGMDDRAAQSDVATTAVATLALVRHEGGTRGAWQKEVRRGTEFVIHAIEQSSPSSPKVATPEGTQPQYKLGKLVDTHLAAMLLGEVAGGFDPDFDARLASAHDVVIGKVQLAQRADGSFDGDGWAPILSNSIAASSLTRAVELGRDVDREVLRKSDAYTAGVVDAPTGTIDTSAGAGVSLYATAAALQGGADGRARGSDGAAKAEAAAAEAIATDDGRLMTGFGSIGGEEMLSYMMISSTLADQGGTRWVEWDEKVGSYLASIQNADGSWVGHHCITSSTFTTSAALLTLAAGHDGVRRW